MTTIKSILFNFVTFVTGCIILSSAMNALAQAGSLDESFQPGIGPNSEVRSIQVLEDGKILIAGWFTQYDGVQVGRIARLYANGDIDTTFEQGEGANSGIIAMAIQSDGKILIGGYFTTYDNTAINRIARLNEDGSLDTTFDPGDGFDWLIWTIALQSDGKIVLGGNFSTYDNIPVNNIIRLLPNGQIDPDFDPGNGADWMVRSLVISPDGKIYIAGHFYNYDGIERIRVARIQSNGQLDFSFDPMNGPNDWVTSMALQPDGKIVIGGYFSSFNGEECKYITRLNEDGSRDYNFDYGLGPNLYVESLLLQSDGRIIIGGLFFDVDGYKYRGVARLNSNGSLDTDFNPGFGINGKPSAFAIQPDDKILLGGYFSKYDNTPILNIARINGINNSTFVLQVDNPHINLFPNPTSGMIWFGNHSPERIEVYDQLGVNVATICEMYDEINLSFLPDGVYFVRLYFNNLFQIHKVIKSNTIR